MVIAGIIVKKYIEKKVTYVIVKFYFFYVKYDGKNCIYIYWRIWLYWWIKYDLFMTRASYLQWLANVRGQCANYNLDKTDDFTMLDGTLATDAWVFGDSYRTDPKCIGKALS